MTTPPPPVQPKPQPRLSVTTLTNAPPATMAPGKVPWWRSNVFMERKPPPEDPAGKPNVVTVGQENIPMTNQVHPIPDIRLDQRQFSTYSMADGEDPRGLLSWGSFRDKQTSGGMNLALYEDPGIPLVSSYIRAYTTPGPAERAQSKKKKANLGVMLGVYLPTIQHILGVTMFIRLFWLVGIAGIGQTFLLLFVCCLCTFLTCISLSAVATNGVVESGGPYFMISRNLGPEFGSAVGILFYLANTVAASMYLVGGIEILLLYIFPEMTIGGHEAHQDTGLMGMMSHNLRIYATVLLIIEFIIVAMGVRFVQLLAPVSLICVIVSILACYAGGIEKTLHPNAGQSVCMLGDRLLQAKVVLPEDADLADICNYCHHNSTSSVIYENFCPNNTCSEEWLTHEMRCINAFPGFGSNALFENLGSNYLKLGEAAYGQQADRKTEVFQDVTTTFFLLMAIYFPAVTGIFTGTNMSGDLANPQSSIPAGTIAAQLTTSFVYFSLALCFGAAIDGNVLRDKYGQSLHGGMVVAYLSWPSPWVLLIGSFLSTFGAALQCLCSAPRLLQSIARDDVIPMLSPFAKVTKNNEPFYGLIITTIIAEMAILMGAVDQIAAVVDFFFLMCYAFVNLICVLHSLLGAPNWRPRFRYYHWSLSLLGASLCFFIMFTTHWDYAIISVVLCLAIYKYVEWKGAKKEWGDGIRGLALSTAQYSIQKIEEKDPHPKNWRPQLLLLFTMPWSKDIVDVRYLNLLNLAGQMKAGKGLTMVVAFVRGNPTSIEDRQKAEKVKERMLFDMGQTRLRGFAKTLVYGETQITGSVSTLIQSVGIGGLRPNTLLLSWPTHDRDSGHEAVDSEYQTFLDKLHAGATMDMCLLVAKGITEFPVSSFRLNGKIDIYWIVQDGGLLILIAYLLKQNKVWRHCKLRVIAIAQEMDNSMKLKSDLEQYVYQLRIDAKVTVVELTDPEISKNAFERTLLMEEGKQMVQKMQVQQQRSKAESPLVTAERKLKEQQERRLDSKSDSSLDELDDSPTSPRRSDGSGSPKVDIRKEMPVIFPKVPESKNNTNAKSPSAERNKKFRELDRQKVHKMHTAVRLNEVITEHSQDSQLILLNLPKPPQREGLDDYIHYLEVLSKDIKRVIFVRGAGKEVITTNS